MSFSSFCLFPSIHTRRAYAQVSILATALNLHPGLPILFSNCSDVNPSFNVILHYPAIDANCGCLAQNAFHNLISRGRGYITFLLLKCWWGGARTGLQTLWKTSAQAKKQSQLRFSSSERRSNINTHMCVQQH